LFQPSTTTEINGDAEGSNLGVSSGTKVEVNFSVRKVDENCENPKDFAEAQDQTDWPLWKQAISEEMKSLKKRDVFGEVIELPEGAQSIGYKWVFNRKRNAQGLVVRHKARLVAKGYKQQYGVDYEETYAPVMDAVTYRYLLALAAMHQLETEVMDVVTAYLYGDLDHTTYMDAPEGHQEARQRGV
jgi:hypothetical protein